FCGRLGSSDKIGARPKGGQVWNGLGQVLNRKVISFGPGHYRWIDLRAFIRGPKGNLSEQIDQPEHTVGPYKLGLCSLLRTGTTSCVYDGRGIVNIGIHVVPGVLYPLVGGIPGMGMQRPPNPVVSPVRSPRGDHKLIGT